MTSRPRVIIESPYAGDTTLHEAYLRRCIRDSLLRGEAPFASHRMYPGALDDSNSDERWRGVEAGYAWWDVADAVVFYIDLGWSTGMRCARTHCEREGRLFSTRKLFP